MLDVRSGSVGLQADHTGEQIDFDVSLPGDVSPELTGTHTRTEGCGCLIVIKATTIAAIAKRMIRPGKIVPDGFSWLERIAFS
jgi:hypothetical protein